MKKECAHFFLAAKPVFVKKYWRCSMLPSAMTLSRLAALRLNGFCGLLEEFMFG
jgi:hypothetical protein